MEYLKVKYLIIVCWHLDSLKKCHYLASNLWKYSFLYWPFEASDVLLAFFGIIHSLQMWCTSLVHYHWWHHNISWPPIPEMQIPTQRYGRRPYGVGLLVAGYDVSSWRNLLQVIPVIVLSIAVCSFWLRIYTSCRG